jgi:hypothetical protein
MKISDDLVYALWNDWNNQGADVLDQAMVGDEDFSVPLITERERTILQAQIETCRNALARTYVEGMSDKEWRAAGLRHLDGLTLSHDIGHA